MENPLVVFALTVEVIDPAVLDEPEPLAAQIQSTTVTFVAQSSEPVVYEPLLKEVNQRG